VSHKFFEERRFVIRTYTHNSINLIISTFVQLNVMLLFKIHKWYYESETMNRM